MSDQIQIDKALLCYRKIIELQKVGIQWFIEMGKTLYDIREERLFKLMGDGGFDTYREFLNNPEIGFSEHSAYVYTQVYEFYILRLKMEPEQLEAMPLNRLKRLIPLLKDKKDNEVKDLLEKVEGQTSSDFDKTLDEDHIHPERPEVYLHDKTGKWIIKFDPKTTEEIIDIESDQNILAVLYDDETTDLLQPDFHTGADK